MVGFIPLGQLAKVTTRHRIPVKLLVGTKDTVYSSPRAVLLASNAVGGKDGCNVRAIMVRVSPQTGRVGR